MQKILVTGVNGFVGKHLAKDLDNNGIPVIGIGGPLGTGQTPSNVESYQVIDLTDAAATRSIDFSEVTGVIHLAGLAAVGPSFDDPRLYIETNTGIEANLFEAAQAQGAHPKFIIVSSGSLYAAGAALPISETSDVIPNSPYAVSKLAQEQLALYYMTRGFEVVIARPFNHIGPGQNLGFIVPDLTKQIIEIERGKIATLVVGNLDARRDYTDVRDITRAYRLLLESGKSGKVYNICSGKSTSGHELLKLIAAATQSSPEVSQDPNRMRPSDTPEVYGSHDELTQDTGWQPSIMLDQTIRDVIEDWRNR